MKVVIDGTEGYLGKLTGTGVYVRGLVRELLTLETSLEISILGVRGLAVEPTYVPQGSQRLLRSLHYRTVWSQVRLPLHLLRERYDLLHMPDHKLPHYRPRRSVITVHDLAFMKYPETFTSSHLRRLLWFTKDSVQRTDHIIAVSHATKRDLCDLLYVDPARVTVVHHGVDPIVFHPGLRFPYKGVPFVLSVGALQPRKNYVLLIRAFKSLCNLLRDRVELIIVGQRGWMWEPIEHEAAEGPFADRIHLKGYVPEGDLQNLYASASAVVFPSRYEGFGIPALEAMACGAPVLAANISSFPEVVGDAGILLDPDDQQAWTEAMQMILVGGCDTERLKEKGFARAKEFSWKIAAEKTLAVYNALLSQSDTR